MKIVKNPVHKQKLQYVSTAADIMKFLVCETAAATAAKVITTTDGYAPTAGDIICVRYTLGTTASSPTLNINGGGAKAIKLGGTAASATTHTITAGGECKYCYDGTEWQMFGSMRTTDSDTIQAVYHPANKTVGVEVTKYKFIFESTDGKFYPLSVGDTLALTKVQSDRPYRIGGLILWYSSATSVDADNSVTATYTEHATSTINYTLNQATGFTNYAPIYLVGSLDTNGDFVLDQTDATSWFTQTLPSTEDGKLYLRLGFNYATTGTLKLEGTHPIYQYKGGKITQYIPDNGEYLKLDQSEPQTVSGGQPTFEDGIYVPSTTGMNWAISLSPVRYNDTDYYIPGDAAVIFWFSPTEDFQIITDTGNYEPILIPGLEDSQPTIYMYLVTAFGGGASITCFSDLTEANFLAYIRALAEDPEATIDYAETAFTFADGEYTKVITKPICADSETTNWANPMFIELYGGFIVGNNVVHTTNYTNGNASSIFKTKGQIKIGDGQLVDIVTAPLAVNQLYRTGNSGGLQFAMVFVPQIGFFGTEEIPEYQSIYIAGMYGTTVIDGENAVINGIALGGWCAVQNALNSGGNVTLTEATAMRAGMTYSSDTNQDLFIGNFSCFQTDCTNLNQGTSSHDNFYHYEARLLSNNIIDCTNNYAFYARDNSEKADNSWGLYSLEPSNYAKKMYLGSTPTKPTEDLEVQANAKMAKCLTPEIKTDTTTATDLTIACGTDKTLVLSESVWDDIQFQISSGRTSQANFPDWDTFTTNTNEYKFDVNDYIDLSANELLHWWKQGTDIHPHLHITTDGANTSGSSQYVKFKVYFAYADTSEVWTETDFDIEKEIPTGTADMTHILANGVALSLPNNLIGTQVKIRVKRIAATTGTEYPNHIFVTQFGIHAEKDTMGSRQIGVK
jgi:hypothetical protein